MDFEFEALRPLKPSSGLITNPSTRSRTCRSGRENAPPLHPNVQIHDPHPPSPSLPKNKAPAPPPVPSHGLLSEDHSPVHGPGDDPAVKVVVRVRPASGPQLINDPVVRNFSPDSLTVGDRAFVFDSVLGPESTQEDVFELVGVPLVRNSLAGFNTSILSYGQSGSGKTYTMWGPPSAMVDATFINSNLGIVPRIFQMLFAEMHRKQECFKEEQTSYQCRCSFLEIYNNQINDLLDPTQKDLQIRDNARNGFHVENLTDEYVTTHEDVIQLLVKGLANRKVGATSMNAKSSRSHIIFTCTIESWSKEFSSKCFSSSKTSRISFVDLAGIDRDTLDGASKQCLKEEKHIKRSLSKLGKLVNILGEAAQNGGDSKAQYGGSCLTQLLQETLGGNAKFTVICNVSPDKSYGAGTLSTLRFGKRARRIQNKAVINEITEDDVNDLSDQIRQLKEELLSAKLGEGNCFSMKGLFKGPNARDSLNFLRVSLNRSLILPGVDLDSEEEMDFAEEDVKELCVQIGNLNSSLEDNTKDKLESCLASEKDVNVAGSTSTPSLIVDSSDREVTICSSEQNRLEERMLRNGSVLPTGDLVYKDACGTASNIHLKSPLRESSILTSPCQQLSVLQDPTICSSPKLDKSLKKSIILSDVLAGKGNACDSPTSNLHVESNVKSSDLIRSSLQSSKINPTESLAASIQRGLQIIDKHQRSSSARRSILGFSFEHLASISNQPLERVDASIMQTLLNDEGTAPLLCSSCKNFVDLNCSKELNDDMGMQIIPVDEENKGLIKNATKREVELEALCASQAATIRHLTCLVDHCEQEEILRSNGGKMASDNSMKIPNHLDLDKETSFDITERESLLLEIQSLKDQLKSFKYIPGNDSLLEHIRNGGTHLHGGDEEYEKERDTWLEAESRWICLTEELRLDLDSNRRLLEKKELELGMEKKCTAELDDALHRSILGHARIVEHYADLQENYNDLQLRHRKVMEGIAEVKKAAAKAGGKGSGSAFAAALAAELSTLRIDREKERSYLREQNRRLKIQLRDTAEAVHAAGELLVRLREAEAAASLAEEKHEEAQQEMERTRKQMEKLKKKHAMELITMKHFLAESRLPESALEPLYHHELEEAEVNKITPAAPDDQSWRAAFQPSYE